MKTALRGAMLTFKDDPFLRNMADCMVYYSDALIIMDNGLISAAGPASELLPGLSSEVSVQHYHDSLIVPGFIDSHVHYVQTPMIAAPGADLLDWLNRYTFNSEQQFSEPVHAERAAEVFLREQLRHGITTASVFCSSHAQSVDALFNAASIYNLRILAGKVCMDRNAPAALLDTPQRAYDESASLARRWHGQGRNEYVITPRFAPTSTPEQLEVLGQLATEWPTALIQSHIAEHPDEVAWVRQLFPQCQHYADVYDHYGLLRERAIFGHGIHLSAAELDVFAATGAAIAHCPSSNFFLGSGSFNLKAARTRQRPVRVGLGTDIGAGTQFSMLQTLGQAYKAAKVCGYTLGPAQAFYQASVGSAQALGLSDKIGRIAPGMEADLAVINLRSTPLIDYRMGFCNGLEEALLIQMMLADDRAISATYVAGHAVLHE